MSAIAETLLATALALLAVTATAIATVIALYRLASKRSDAIVVVSVSILTLVSIFAAVSASGELSTALITLAGTGLGALAGAVTALFNADKEKPMEQPNAVDGPVVPDNLHATLDPDPGPVAPEQDDHDPTAPPPPGDAVQDDEVTS